MSETTLQKEMAKLKPAVKKEMAKLKPATTAAKVRAMMPQIQEQLANGVPYADIVAALNEAGLELAPRNFETILYRYRKKHGAAAPAASAQPPAEPEADAAGEPAAAPEPPAATEQPAAKTETDAQKRDREALERTFNPETRYKTADRLMRAPNPRLNKLGTTPRKK